jgi:metacaspase-1
MTTTRDEYVEKMIPSDFRMISGCEDAQTSADVSDVANFQLPDPAGRAGGACTSALLQILYGDHKDTAKDLSFEQALLKMRGALKDMGYSQIPQMTGSRKVELRAPFHIVPPGCKGIKRALLIGINYVGQQGELTGCHNDVANVSGRVFFSASFFWCFIPSNTLNCTECRSKNT